MDIYQFGTNNRMVNMVASDGFYKSGRGKNNLFEIKVSQVNLTPQYLLC